MPNKLATLRDTVRTAFAEIVALYELTTKQGALTNWKVSESTDELLHFRTKYNARLVASKALRDKENLRVQLIDDLKRWLHNLVAFKEYLDATTFDDVSQIQLDSAVARYNARGRALEVFIKNLNAVVEPMTGDISFAEAQSPLLTILKGKSEREIFQVVSRVIPAQKDVDEHLTGLLYMLITEIHREPAVQALVTPANSLIDNDDGPLRQLADSQELRDYVVPYLAALLKKALSEEGVEAFDESFRNTYFAVVNRVQTYYREFVPPEAATPPVNGKSSGVNGSAPSPLTVHDSPALETLPELTEPEKPTVPLVTEAEIESAEALADGQTVSVGTSVPVKKSGSKVKGTGLN